VRDIQLMEQWWWMGGPDPTFQKGYMKYPSLAALRYLIQEVWRHRKGVDREPFPIDR
jgi:4-alpha-glucanotransferase